MSAEQFLRKILPSEGRYCVAAFYSNSKGAHHTWCPSIEDLVKQLELKDSTADAVYHACATYGDKRNAKGRIERTKANVYFLRSLYCETDIREGDKGYNTKEEALAALDAFLETTKLPKPCVVDSGGGYHLYWPLTENVTRDVWEKYALGLKTQTAKLGFKVDVGITADCARILRTPGTTNRKYPNTIVQLVRDADPNHISKFLNLLLQNPKPIKPVYERTLGDPDAILAKCAQLRLLRDNPSAQSGETWIATGRLLAQCTGGEQLFNEWSSKDPRYNADETAKKWAESVKHNNAPLCTRFETVNPSGCEGCPLRGKIKTPIVIGREQTYKLPDDVGSVLAATELPRGFKFDANGKLMYATEKQNAAGEAEEKITYVTEFPVIVEDRHISEVTGEDFTLTIKHWQPHDGWKTVHVDASDFLRNTEAAFGGKGIFSSDDGLLKKYVKQSLNMIANKRAASMSYETMGWKAEENGATPFLLGNKLFSFVKTPEGGTVKTELVVLTDAAKRIAHYLGAGGARNRGTYKSQREAIQELAAQGFEWQFATVIASCAAILMPLILQSEGGLVWSTYDYKGGAGKTLAATAAASIWGDFEGLSTVASDTPKSRIAALGVLRHLPQFFDEMKRTDPELAREHMQVFTSGKEGTRLTQGGEFQKHARNWCTVMITSSNQELEGAIKAAEGSKAMLTRIFEVQATDLPLPKKDYKESFKHKFINNPGHIGEMFVKAVVFLKGMGILDQMITSAENHLLENYQFDAQQRYKFAFFVAMYVASNILVEADILSFSPERIMTWLLNENGTAWREDHKVEMTEILASYMQEKLRGTLVVPGEYASKPLMVLKPPSDEVSIRIEETGNIYLGKNQLSKWLQTKDISIRHFVEELEAAGVMKSAKAKRSLGAGTVFNTGQSWCLIINGRHKDIASIIATDNVIDMEEAKRSLR